MLMNYDSQIVTGVEFKLDINLESSIHYVERVYRECLEPVTGSEVLECSAQEISDRLYEILLSLSKFVSEYTSAIEAMENLEVELSLDEFRGEF